MAVQHVRVSGRDVTKKQKKQKRRDLAEATPAQRRRLGATCAASAAREGVRDLRHTWPTRSAVHRGKVHGVGVHQVRPSGLLISESMALASERPPGHGQQRCLCGKCGKGRGEAAWAARGAQSAQGAEALCVGL